MLLIVKQNKLFLSHQLHFQKKILAQTQMKKEISFAGILAEIYLADSLVISCVGYKLKVIPITESRYYNIELEERSIQLEQVNIISKEKWNVERLNILSECGNIGITTDGCILSLKYFSSIIPKCHSY